MIKIICSIALLSIFASIQAQDWQTDFEKAKELASADDKTIILVFQGSDWCAPCIKLDKEIWSKDEFIAYANDNYVMVKADFPRKKKNALAPELEKQNRALADTYNKKGYFPYVAILDKDGNKLGSTGYKRTNPKKYIKIIESFKS